MEFAINFSYQALELFKKNSIPLDRFKCPDWPHLIKKAARYRPVAVHFTLNAGNGKLAETDWELVQNWLDHTGTPYVNIHIAPTSKHYPEINLEHPDKDQETLLIDNLLKDIHAVVERFGAERVIAENTPYHADRGHVIRTGAEVAVISRLVNETGCGLLLDLSHARIAAHYLGVDEHDYLCGLPVDRIRELHFTGLHQLNGRLQDHLEALPDDWVELGWALERIKQGDWNRPWLLAFEYGGVGEKFAWRSESSVIGEQAPRLYRMLQGV